MWKIKSFPGGREFLLRCKFGLPSVEAEEEQQGRMPPIRVNFEIPYFTVSGIQVRALPCHERTDVDHTRENVVRVIERSLPAPSDTGCASRWLTNSSNDQSLAALRSGFVRGFSYVGSSVQGGLRP